METSGLHRSQDIFNDTRGHTSAKFSEFRQWTQLILDKSETGAARLAFGELFKNDAHEQFAKV